MGGCLSPEWLTAAYERGIFPWPIPSGGRRHLLAWFCPDPRTILPLDTFHLSRRLLRRIRRGEFTVTFNQAFAEVMRACAERPAHEGTWITAELINAYTELHARRLAHSVEVWQQQQLVGGLYGVAVGGCFSAESMFHRRTDASKVALYALVERLRQDGFTMLDVQVWSDHLGQFGAVNVPRAEFLERLEHALHQPTSPTFFDPKSG